jgi:UDP-GlcNAc3NAcA epimerase
LNLAPKTYVLATVHRAENTDDAQRLSGILEGLCRAGQKSRVVLAMHPRTRKSLRQHGLEERLGKVEVIDPVSYLDMIRLEEAARAICTDSGGVQKEAYFFRVPCITLREETEWVETVQSGWNCLVGAEPERIARALLNSDRTRPSTEDSLYGDGHASNRIVEILD